MAPDFMNAKKLVRQKKWKYRSNQIKKEMKKLTLFIVSTVMLVSCNQNQGTHSQPQEMVAPETDGVFIHISEGYNDPHRALMPLKMASIMAGDKDVLIYFDIHAEEFLIKGSEDIFHPEFESVHTYLRQLIEKT